LLSYRRLLLFYGLLSSAIRRLLLLLWLILAPSLPLQRLVI
jgi:hypothetical protein